MSEKKTFHTSCPRVSAKREHYTQLHREIITQQLTWGKWLSASLLAVNGASLAVLLKPQTSSHALQYASFSFAAGLILAMLSGAALQEIYRKIAPIALMQRDYWVGVDSGKARHRGVELRIKKKARKIYRWAWIAPFFGWLSGLSFLIGLMFLVSNLGGVDDQGMFESSKAGPKGNAESSKQ